MRPGQSHRSISSSVSACTCGDHLTIPQTLLLTKKKKDVLFSSGIPQRGMELPRLPLFASEAPLLSFGVFGQVRAPF